MPEGDTLAGIARRLQGLVGATPTITAPQPRHAAMRLPERLAGARVTAVEARGKHLLIRFDNDLTVHSHLRMSGRWEVGPPGRTPGRPRDRAWLVVATDTLEARLYNGPVLELLTPAQIGLHPTLGRLGPDALAEAGFDVRAAVARARRGPAEQTAADALLDQRILAGVGNVWKSEALFACRLDPWTRVGDLDDAALADLLERAATMMRRHVASGAMRRPVRIYGRARRPCPACGTPIRARAQGDQGRRTYWCPRCQPPVTAPDAPGSTPSG